MSYVYADRTIAAMKAFLAKNLRYREIENLLLKACVPTELRSPRNYDSKLGLLNRVVDALLLSGRTDVLDTLMKEAVKYTSVSPKPYFFNVDLDNIDETAQELFQSLKLEGFEVRGGEIIPLSENTGERVAEKASSLNDALQDHDKAEGHAAKEAAIHVGETKASFNAIDNQYDVALSFAEEDRSYAERLADTLKQRGVKVFYDRFEKASLWGKNLYTHYAELFQSKASYCVIFLSKHYPVDLWARHALNAAQARAIREPREYILPIRLDGTEAPATLSNIGLLNWLDETAETITDVIIEKLGEINERS